MKKYLLPLYFIIFFLPTLYGNVTQEQKKAIGMQIWRNEGAGQIENLVFWNIHESFLSLGIGHFIWYPAGKQDIYTQTFSQLIDFFQQKKVALPDWLIAARKTGAPWHNREDFILHTQQVNELRTLLSSTINVQVDFIMQRLEQAEHRIYSHADIKKRSQMKRHFKQLKKTPQGLYALIDYLNFKGEGVNLAERYNDQGWGLLQVLEEMPTEYQNPQQAVLLFAQTAQKVLERRVANAPVCKSHEQKWLVGWQHRINTYLTFKAA